MGAQRALDWLLVFSVRPRLSVEKKVFIMRWKGLLVVAVVAIVAVAVAMRIPRLRGLITGNGGGTAA